MQERPQCGAFGTSQILPRRRGMDSERVHTTGELVGERRIDHAMALDPALSAKGFRHDIKSEMRFTAGPVPGMALVPMRFILDMKAFGCESLVQLFRDQIASVHGKWLSQRTRLRSIPPHAHFCRLSSLEGAMQAPA
jgi:hypothetical protein